MNSSARSSRVWRTITWHAVHHAAHASDASGAARAGPRARFDNIARYPMGLAGEMDGELAPCLPHVDILFANEDEARMLTGQTHAEAVARSFRERGARTIVLKQGGNGCSVYTSGAEFHARHSPCRWSIRPAQATVSLEPTSRRSSAANRMRDAAPIANLVGSMVVQTLGAVEGVRNWDETLARLACLSQLGRSAAVSRSESAEGSKRSPPQNRSTSSENRRGVIRRREVSPCARSGSDRGFESGRSGPSM